MIVGPNPHQGAPSGDLVSYTMRVQGAQRKQVLTYSVIAENKFGLFQSLVIESMR